MVAKISDRQKMLLCLIGAGGTIEQKNEPIFGSVKLMKQAFLIKNELGNNKFPYNFVPYDYGPCSFEVYEDLSFFIREGLVNENKKNNFSTYSVASSYEELVKKMINNLEPEVREVILKIKKQFNKLSYYALIYYVYQKYPQFTKASRFRL